MVKWLAKRIGRRMLSRLLTRRSPKADLVGGSAIALLITGAMLAFDVPPEAAAALGANLGAIGTTLANLMFGDDPVPEKED